VPADPQFRQDGLSQSRLRCWRTDSGQGGWLAREAQGPTASQPGRKGCVGKPCRPLRDPIPPSPNLPRTYECAWELQASLRGARRSPTFPGAERAGLLSDGPFGAQIATLSFHRVVRNL